MSGSQVSGVILPFGGAIRLDMPGYVVPPSGVSFTTISRAVSGVSGLSSFTQLYSGSPCLVWIDPGDGLPSPLAASGQYVYRVEDDLGATTIGPITPAMAIVTKPDRLTQLFIRLLQCTADNAVLAPGIERVTAVAGQMPQGGWQAMPFVVVNLDLMQQTEWQIGQDVPDPDPSGVWNIAVYAKRLWRVSVFGRSATERDYWRDTMLAAFQAMLPSVFMQIGIDVRHRFQVMSTTDAQEWEGHVPGFYASDMMVEVDGVFEVALFTPYSLIEKFAVTAVFPDGEQQVIHEPPY